MHALDKHDTNRQGDAHSPITDMREVTVLWMKAQPIVEAYVYSVIRDAQAAEDVVQQVAVVAVESFGRWSRKSSFSTWAVGIAKNKVKMHLRKKGNDLHVFDEKTLDDIAHAHAEIGARVDPMKEALRHCMKQLRGRSREIIELRYLDALSPLVISEKLGLTRNNVLVVLHRVRVALGQCIKSRIRQEESL